MKEQLIKEITDEVVKYVPNVENFYYKQKGIKVYRNTTLEDILIAVDNIGGVGVRLGIHQKIIYIYDNVKTLEAKWELGKTANEQSVETLQFIRDILK